MPGLGPDMSALNLLSQANLSSVLNKVKQKLAVLLEGNQMTSFVDSWQKAVNIGAWPNEAARQNCKHECFDKSRSGKSI